jgi:hypothetical protein
MDSQMALFETPGTDPEIDEEWRLMTTADVRHWTTPGGWEPRGAKPRGFTGIRETDRSWYVYRMWDEAGECLYLGHTGWLRKRMNDHRARLRGDWLEFVQEIDICAYPSKEAMEAAEDAWFLRLSPYFNTLRPVNVQRRAETAKRNSRK